MKFPNVGGPELEHEHLAPVPHPDLDLDRSILHVVAKKDVLVFFTVSFIRLYHTFFAGGGY
jgi:hypothetical protein